MIFNSKISKEWEIVLDMEFFRKNQRIIVLIIAITFIAWTFGLMLLPLLVR